jgi:hypothetical protein
LLKEREERWYPPQGGIEFRWNLDYYKWKRKGWDVLMISEQDKMMNPRRMSFSEIREGDILNIKSKKVKLFLSPQRDFLLSQKINSINSKISSPFFGQR